MTTLSPATPFGKTAVSHSDTTSVLTPGRGFIEAYDFSLNSYIGCSFGCSYCYVPTLTPYGPHRDKFGDWGSYAHVKTRAVSTVQKAVSKVQGKTIYMSPVTDPYQPVERVAMVTRGILGVLQGSDVALTVQTRSPLITRDIDLLSKFNVRVNFTVTTDDVETKRAYEPGCATFPARLKAIRALTDAGITTVATCCPLLPLNDPNAFADQIKDVGVSWVVIQKAHSNKTGARTPKSVLLDIQNRGWDTEAYQETYGLLKDRFAPLPVYEEKIGFQPVVPHMQENI